MAGAFLDASILRNKQVEEAIRYNVQQNNIRFEFPQGFEQLRLIEECRALNALDVSDPDNFDLMYDITMQMLTGKVVFVYFVDDDLVKYPVLMNWLVEFIAGMLGKKYPRSLKNIQATMSEREERMKSLNQNQATVKASFQNK